VGELIVGALVAVNAWGDVRSPTGDLSPLAEPLGALMRAPDEAGAGTFLQSTTIGVVATNAALDKTACLLVAQGGHDGLARALEPVHSQADGDALVVAATGPVAAPVDAVRVLAARAVEAAVRGGVA
jgi:L-aminopeptidase/D-esterase-like protein